MGTGYGGTYRGSVVDNVDPVMQSRLLVLVPEVSLDPAWANPSFASQAGQLPAIGEGVLVSFEGGDSDYPVWQSIAAPEPSAPGAGGYVGSYRATVIDNIDPTQTNRLQVSVPDVLGFESVWATRSPSMGEESALPEVGSAVWVQFEGGDPNHPVWVGLA